MTDAGPSQLSSCWLELATDEQSPGRQVPEVKQDALFEPNTLPTNQVITTCGKRNLAREVGQIVKTARLLTG